MKTWSWLFIHFFSTLIMAKEIAVYSLPMTCAELIPETSPFIAFFEATARGSVVKDKAMAKRLFRILSLRERINDTPDKLRELNPIDTLIRKTLCYYREQKEPIKPVPFDDEKYLSFIRASLPELEAKAKESVFDTEFLRASKKHYESKLKQNETIIEQMENQAKREASQEYEAMKDKAKRKVIHQ